MNEAAAERLARFDDQFPELVSARPIPGPSPLIAQGEGLGAAPTVHNGFYTLGLPDGGHRTFRISTQPTRSKFAPGRRIISLLIGPVNTSDYEGFGFITDAGVEVWQRWRNDRRAALAEILWALATGDSPGGPMEGYTLSVSRRCLLCNRELTTPESLERGIGPSCWKRVQ